jgi:adenylate kinase family enzyme
VRSRCGRCRRTPERAQAAARRAIRNRRADVAADTRRAAVCVVPQPLSQLAKAHGDIPEHWPVVVEPVSDKCNSHLWKLLPLAVRAWLGAGHAYVSRALTLLRVKRVVVLGTSGAGKTTLAAALSRLHELPHIDLDVLAAGPDRHQKAPTQEFRARVSAVLDGPRWVIDGDYERGRTPGRWTGSTKLGDLVLGRADTAIWLDLPLRVSVRRMWNRTSERIRTMRTRGERARLTLEHLRWLQWESRSHLRRRLTMKGRLARHAALTVVHLKSQSQIDAWLESQRSRLDRQQLGSSRD